MTQVKKRNGNVVDFDPNRIAIAIIKAMRECGEETVNEELANQIANECYLALQEKEIIDIEDIQDYVEIQLMSHLPHVAKRYIVYRLERQRLRQEGWEMTDLQRDIYESKYRYGKESFEEFLDRVSGGNQAIKKLMRDKKFIPAGRILAGRGLSGEGKKVTLSNCYVLPKPEDSLESIFDTAKEAARTYSYGGGIGINISKLRPRGAQVNNAARTTSGAVSFMDLYSLTTELIGQAGRRGALMLNIDVTHPDIEEFINIKTDLTKVTKANTSVNITDDFMEAVKNNDSFKLHFEVNNEQGEIIEKEVDALTLFEQLCYNNWLTAEPGMLFQERIDSWHLMSEDPDFEYAGVNPCAV